MSVQDFPNELLIDVFQRLPLSALICAHQVDRRWRQLCATIENRLWNVYLSTPKDVTSAVALPSSDQLVTQTVRRSYVDGVECRRNITIPEPYRTYLMEWPSKWPAPALGPWPHAVRFFANGVCSCDREMNERGICFCRHMEVEISSIGLRSSLLAMIRQQEPFVYEGPHDDVRWELFDNGRRLQGEERGEKTKRYILAHPPEMWEDDGRWAWCRIRTLRLSRYEIAEKMDNGEYHFSDGDFRIHLEGPSRGEIHAWGSSSWYDGFEARDFLDFKYEEWKPLPEHDP